MNVNPVIHQLISTEALISDYAITCVPYGLKYLMDLINAPPADQLNMLHIIREENDSLVNCCLDYMTPPAWHAKYGVFFERGSTEFVGDDRGPNAAWGWDGRNVSENYPPVRYTINPRKWAYVMWDKERLDEFVSS